jgi:hypothetical protein
MHIKSLTARQACSTDQRKSFGGAQPQSKDIGEGNQQTLDTRSLTASQAVYDTGVFPTVDVRGKSCTITCPGIGAYSPETNHVLLPVARLMKAGNSFMYRIPMNTIDDGFPEFQDYVGYV